MANKKTSIGGQALIEGIMMRGPEKTAMAVRNASGKIITEEWETSSKVPKICKLPIIRGVYGMVSSLVLGYKCMLKSADIAISDALEEPDAPAEESIADVIDQAEAESADPANTGTDTPAADPEPAVKADTQSEKPSESAKQSEQEGKSEKSNAFVMGIITVFSVLFALVLMIGLFVLVPSFLGGVIFGDKDSLSNLMWLGRSAFEGVLKIVLLVLYMWAISFMKDIRRTFRYHGAEHKTIFCYEHGHPLTVENIRKEGRFHPRCGTSFLILMLIVSIFIGFFIRVDNPFLRSGIKILLLPITVGFGYELIKFAGRHDNILTKIISAPGVALQHITVLEPDDAMIECAIKAMTAVIPEDKTKDNW